VKEEVITLPCRIFRKKYYRFIVEGDITLKKVFHKHIIKCEKCNNDFKQSNKLETILTKLCIRHKEKLNTKFPFPSAQFNSNLLSALQNSKQDSFASLHLDEYNSSLHESNYNYDESGVTEEHPFAETVPGVIPVCNPKEYEYTWFFKNSNKYLRYLNKFNQENFKTVYLKFGHEFYSKIKKYTSVSLDNMGVFLKEKTHPLISNTAVAKAGVAFSCIFIISGILFNNYLFPPKDNDKPENIERTSSADTGNFFHAKEKIINSNKPSFHKAVNSPPIVTSQNKNASITENDDPFIHEGKPFAKDTNSSNQEPKVVYDFEPSDSFPNPDFSGTKNQEHYKTLQVDFTQDDILEFNDNDLFLIFFHPVNDSNFAKMSKGQKAEKDLYLKADKVKSKKALMKPVSFQGK